jgi:hypothetical protein
VSPAFPGAPGVPRLRSGGGEAAGGIGPELLLRRASKLDFPIPQFWVPPKYVSFEPCSYTVAGYVSLNTQGQAWGAEKRNI